MTVRGAAVRREIEDEHESLSHALNVRDLDFLVYVMYS